MAKVRARPYESIGQLLGRFKRLCQREGIPRDTMRCMYYEKPSEKKRRRIRRSRQRLQKEYEDGKCG